MTGNRIFKLSLLVFIVALAATSVVFVATSEIGVKASGPVGPVIPTWPQFTMVYETAGPAIAIGQNPAEVTREVRRLEYQSETQWKDIVIEAPTIETRVGQFNRVGSFQQLNGRTFTEFDALGGSSHETTVEEGTRVTKLKPRWDVHLPGAGKQAGNLERVLRPLIAGRCGSGASPLLSGWPAH